ncbi:MAG: 50S ribosomal protein L11 methyltransferase [Ruminococcaceae bacterium]|nr:50S ribosomal protein L11 methyltransferase [Oscillospiraceae bacterium]
MDWILVTIYTSSEGIEPLSGVLYQAGITGIEIEDEADFKSFLEENRESWDYVDEDLLKEKEKETCVKVYVSDNASGHEMLSAIRTAVSELAARDTEKAFGRLEIDLGNVSEEDWANNWKQYFHPTEIGEKILIKPEWEELSEPTDRIVFEVNPGMSFGTGSHETTQLCIEALEQAVKPGDEVLDLGCGSGILSIIAILLGAESALAIDIDPNAVDIAKDNARKNGVSMDKFIAKAGNVLTDEALMQEIRSKKYPIVVANIVADVIIGLLPTAKEAVAADGVFITSGIISDRIEDVCAAIEENGFVIEQVNRRGDWASIICRLG